MSFTLKVAERAGDIVPAFSFWDDNFAVAMADVDNKAGGGGDAGEARAQRAPYLQGLSFGNSEMLGPVDGIIMEKIIGADALFGEGGEEFMQSIGVVVYAFKENSLAENSGVGFFTEAFENFQGLWRELGRVIDVKHEVRIFKL